MNLAENAEAYKSGQHEGFVDTAWEGLKESIDVIASRGIKVVINGGGLNPSGLAERVSMLVSNPCHDSAQYNFKSSNRPASEDWS
jgi:hypothetical protein